MLHKLKTPCNSDPRLSTKVPILYCDALCFFLGSTVGQCFFGETDSQEVLHFANSFFRHLPIQKNADQVCWCMQNYVSWLPLPCGEEQPSLALPLPPTCQARSTAKMHLPVYHMFFPALRLPFLSSPRWEEWGQTSQQRCLLTPT